MSSSKANNTSSNEAVTFSDTLWNGTASTRSDILTGSFIHQIVQGELDPSKFGKFGVQDTIYIYKSLASINLAKSKAVSDDIRNCLDQLSQDYTNLLASMKTTWSVNDADGFSLDPATKSYVDYIHSVASSYPPVYTLVAVLPCMRLWPWLGGRMPKANMDLYRTWAEKNFNPDDQSYRAVELVVDNAHNIKKIDTDKAQAIYNRCMTNEKIFFAAFA